MGDPPAPTMLSNPKYWELRAEEARVMAASMSDPEARRMMLGVAETYEVLARRFAAIPKAGEKPPGAS